MYFHPHKKSRIRTRNKKNIKIFLPRPRPHVPAHSILGNSQRALMRTSDWLLETCLGSALAWKLFLFHPFDHISFPLSLSNLVVYKRYSVHLLLSISSIFSLNCWTVIGTVKEIFDTKVLDTNRTWTNWAELRRTEEKESTTRFTISFTYARTETKEY